MQEECSLPTIKVHQEEGIIQLVRPWLDVAPRLFVFFPTGYGKTVIIHGAGTMLAGLTMILCPTVGLCADQMEALQGPKHIIYALPWMKGLDILELFNDTDNLPFVHTCLSEERHVCQSTCGHAIFEEFN